MLVEIILGVLALFFIQTLVGPVIQYLGVKGERVGRLRIALGPRDNPPPIPAVGKRANRALLNMFEALPLFLSLALLALILDVSEGLATTGAATFLAARIFYLPAYISGVPLLRSLVWGIGMAGLIMMFVAVARAA